jgi:hypothetical protein
MTEEIDSSVVQAVTGDISDNFSDAEQTEGNYGRFITADCRQKRKLFILKSHYTAGGWRSGQ